MATEKPTPAAPEEPVSPAAEAVQPSSPATEPVAEPARTAAPAATETPAAQATGEPAQVDFADEEAALAARQAGLEIEGETDEEAAEAELAESADGASAEDGFAGKSKDELLDLFARMLAERPVQSIRRDIEALKIAFYRLRRAEVEAARRAFVEAGGAEEEFVPTEDGAEVRLKDLFRSTASVATNSSRGSKPNRRPTTGRN